ncbi:MAG: hypothetical protein ACTSX9_08585 [Candidatus Njordarchaeales archaeon]|mgnify:CR=1 FL=1
MLNRRRVKRVRRNLRKKQILTLLYFKPLSQKDLSEKLGIRKSWVNELVKELIREGSVEPLRRKGSRKILLKITEKGRQELTKPGIVDCYFIKKLVEEVLEKNHVEYGTETELLHVSFDFKIGENKYVKIINGLVIPQILSEVREMLALEKYEKFVREILDTQVILDLVDHKGILMSVFSIARIKENCEFLLLICGNDPKTWPIELCSVLDSIAEELNWQILKGAKERLEKELEKSPENIKVIHIADKTIKEIEKELLRFIKTSS